MALYAFDGTWNAGKTGEDPQFQNTNVVRFFNAYHAHSGKDDFYLAGVGTRFDAVGKVLGGVFGLGELARILEAYDHLCRNWVEHHDTAIDVVGFSRGAATTLGPLIGTLFMYYVVDITSSYTSAYLLIVGAALILLVLFFPKGVLGTVRDRWARWLP